MGKQNWGRLGKRFLKKCLKRQFLGKKRAFEAVFQNSDLPLTPSFVGSNPATPAKRHGFDRVFFVLHGLFGKNRTSACDYFTRSGLRFSVQISVLSRIELLRFRLFTGCRDSRVYLFRGREVFVTELLLHDFDIHAPLHAVCSERMPQHVPSG